MRLRLRHDGSLDNPLPEVTIPVVVNAKPMQGRLIFDKYLGGGATGTDCHRDFYVRLEIDLRKDTDD